MLLIAIDLLQASFFFIFRTEVGLFWGEIKIQQLRYSWWRRSKTIPNTTLVDNHVLGTSHARDRHRTFPNKANLQQLLSTFFSPESTKESKADTRNRQSPSCGWWDLFSAKTTCKSLNVLTNTPFYLSISCNAFIKSRPTSTKAQSFCVGVRTLDTTRTIHLGPYFGP